MISPGGTNTRASGVVTSLSGRSSGGGSHRRAAVALLPLLLIVAGCTTPEPTPTASAGPSPFADCTTLRPATDGTTTRSAPAGAPELAGLSLSCFTGGQQVALDTIPGPAVITLWASWCPPCRKELPAFQRLADRAGDQVRVVGVNTRDGRSQAESVGTDFGLRFPNLVDREETLLRRIARPLLPATLFVARQGRVRHVDQSGALDDAALAELVGRHLDVRVPA